MQYLIGEAAKKLNTTIETLRFYDRSGLYSPKYIDKNNKYRKYDEDDLLILGAIIKLKNLGMPLSDIKKILFNSSNEDVAKSLSNLIDNLNKMKKELDVDINRLSFIKERYSQKDLYQIEYFSFFERMSDKFSYIESKNTINLDLINFSDFFKYFREIKGFDDNKFKDKAYFEIVNDEYIPIAIYKDNIKEIAPGKTINKQVVTSVLVPFNKIKEGIKALKIREYDKLIIVEVVTRGLFGIDFLLSSYKSF